MQHAAHVNMLTCASSCFTCSRRLPWYMMFIFRWSSSVVSRLQGLLLGTGFYQRALKSSGYTEGNPGKLYITSCSSTHSISHQSSRSCHICTPMPLSHRRADRVGFDGSETKHRSFSSQLPQWLSVGTIHCCSPSGLFCNAVKKGIYHCVAREQDSLSRCSQFVHK